MKMVHENPDTTRLADQPVSGIVGVFIALSIIGFVAMWSGSSGYAIRMGKQASYFALRQLVFFALSAVVFIFSASVPIDKVRSMSSLLAFLSLASLVLPFIPGIGLEMNGARRWIDLYFTNFQPSELWKPLSIVYAAHILDKKNQAIKNSAAEAIFPFLVIVVGTVIIYLQDDFSTAVLSLTASLSVFWLAGTPLMFFLGIGLIAVPAVFLMVTSSEYRLVRILGFIIPDYDPHGMNYQVQNSIRAIISGGIWGKGLGLGTRKISTIPEVQSDFVFAAFAEETGLLGVLVVFACWAFLAVKVIKAARNKTGFRALLALGLFCLLSIEFLMNLGVVSGFLPATGIALPFFSAGGSSLLSTALAGGLIVNALKDNGFEPVSGFEASQDLGGYVNG